MLPLAALGLSLLAATVPWRKKTFVTLGDLISAAYEVGGSTDAAAMLLSPLSPLSHLLGRRIVVAT